MTICLCQMGLLKRYNGKLTLSESYCHNTTITCWLFLMDDFYVCGDHTVVLHCNELAVSCPTPLFFVMLC